MSNSAFLLLDSQGEKLKINTIYFRDPDEIFYIKKITKQPMSSVWDIEGLFFRYRTPNAVYKKISLFKRLVHNKDQAKHLSYDKFKNAFYNTPEMVVEKFKLI